MISAHVGGVSFLNNAQFLKRGVATRHNTKEAWQLGTMADSQSAPREEADVPLLHGDHDP